MENVKNLDDITNKNNFMIFITKFLIFNSKHVNFFF